MASIAGMVYGISFLQSNYYLANTNNIYNFIINTLEITEEENKKIKILEKLKMQIGMQFYQSFKEYINKKYAIDHPLTVLLSRN